MAETTSVRDEAARLLGKLPLELVTADDAALRRFVVDELVGETTGRSDSYVQAAFSSLTSGDPRIAQVRRDLRKQRQAELLRMPVLGATQ